MSTPPAAPADQPPQAASPMRPFKLPPATWIAWGVVAAGFVVGRSVAPQPLTALDIGRLLGIATSLLVFPAIAAWLGWRLAGRSARVGAITFFAALGLVTAAQIAETTRPARDQRGIDRAGERLTDELQRVQQRMTAATAAADLNALGDPAKLRDKTLLAERRALVVAAQRANLELRDAVLATEHRFRDLLRRENVSAREIDRALDGFHAQQRDTLPHVVRVREADDRQYAAMIEVIDLLVAEWERWRIDNGRVIFADAALRERFLKIWERVDAIDAERKAAAAALTRPGG